MTFDSTKLEDITNYEPMGHLFDQKRTVQAQFIMKLSRKEVSYSDNLLG